MESRGMLKSHEGWNLLLKAMSRLGNTGALITTYNDMEAHSVQPELSTYHLIVDSLLASENRKTITGVVFPLWRAIVQDYPHIQPDVELMNKFIRSCKLSQHYERAFFFLRSMKDCNVTPNLETFRELFDVSEKSICCFLDLLHIPLGHTAQAYTCTKVGATKVSSLTILALCPTFGVSTAKQT